MDWLTWNNLPNVGGWTLFVSVCLILIRLFSTGKIISLKLHRERMEDKDSMIAIWKESSKENAAQVKLLLQPAIAFEQLFTELRAEVGSGEK